MLSPEAQNYITQSRAAGMTDEQIKQNLVGQGWQEEDITRALVSRSAIVSVPQNSSPNPKKHGIFTLNLFISLNIGLDILLTLGAVVSFVLSPKNDGSYGVNPYGLAFVAFSSLLFISLLTTLVLVGIKFKHKLLGKILLGLALVGIIFAILQIKAIL